MKSHPHPRSPAIAALFAWALASLASGQTAATPGAGTQQPAKDQVVTMEDFSVTGQSEEGYAASESMSGSRIPTKIQDLPFNVEVVTSEFLDDFHIVDPSTMLNAGVITLDQDAGNSYTVRGISATGQLYNGFWQPAGIPVPTALIDRREVIKGPSAGAYGQAAPGGMLNIVTKQPKDVAAQQIDLMYGDHNEREVRLTSTGPVTKNTDYLAIASFDEAGFVQPLHIDKDLSAALSVVHKFGENVGDLKVDIVAEQVRNASPDNRVAYLFNSKEPTPVVAKDVGYYTGYDLGLEDINATGPISYKHTDNYSVFGVYERHLGDIFSLRIGGDAYADNNRSFDTSDITAYDPNPADASTNPYSSSFYGLVRFRNAGSSYTAPSYQVDNKDGGGGQADLLAHYFLFNRAMENRTLLTFDYASMYEYIIKRGMPQAYSVSSAGTLSTSNAVDQTVIPATPQFAGDGGYWVPVIDPNAPVIIANAAGYPTSIYNVPLPSSKQYILTSWQKARTDDFGTMLRQQTTLWDRLLLFAAVRFDNVMYNNFTLSYPGVNLIYHPELAAAWQAAYLSKNTNPIAHYHADAFTPSGGISYRVVPDISIYGNYSSSFQASTQQVTGATTGSYFLPNQRATGYDYGTKASFLDNEVIFTLGGFYIDQRNVSVTSTDALGNTIKEASGTVTSKGFEATGNWYVSSSFGLNAGFYRTNARWGDTGSDLDLQGRTKALVPPDIVTGAATYRLGGALNGLRVFARYQYASPTRAEDGGGQTTTGTFYQNGEQHTGSYTPVGSNNGLRNIILASSATIDMGAAYEFKVWHVGNRLQFNVNNVLDKHYVTFSRGVGMTRTWEVSDRLSF